MNPIGQRVEVAELRERHPVLFRVRLNRAEQLRLELGDGCILTELHIEMHEWGREASVLKDPIEIETSFRIYPQSCEELVSPAHQL